ASRGLALRVHSKGGEGEAALRTDPLWLGRALANLLDNACKFTPRGGVVELTLSARAGHAEVVVRDDGPGLDGPTRAHLFERFQRGAGARGEAEGFGLGLAVARDLARALGGDLQLVDSARGAAFALTVPLVDVSVT